MRTYDLGNLTITIGRNNDGDWVWSIFDNTSKERIDSPQAFIDEDTAQADVDIYLDDPYRYAEMEQAEQWMRDNGI